MVKKLVREDLESFEDFEPGKVERNGLAYTQTQEFIEAELTRYLKMYRDLQQVDQTARLIRDQIDGLLRRYHDYVIQGKIQAHYRQVGITSKKGNVFEHVIPARTVRNLLIAGRLTLEQALNSPTCLITNEANQSWAADRMVSPVRARGTTNLGVNQGKAPTKSWVTII